MRRVSGFLLLLFCFQSFILFSQGRSNLRHIGVKQLQNALYLEALNTLNDAIRYEPTASDLYFFRGYAKYGLDDFIGAEEVLKNLELILQLVVDNLMVDGHVDLDFQFP